MLTRNGTAGRVYGGDCDLIHVPDGQRGRLGKLVASFISTTMRLLTVDRTDTQRDTQLLCPGCFMIVGFNAMLALADANGQPRRELAKSMIGAFQLLLDNPDQPPLEEINVALDPA